MASGQARARAPVSLDIGSTLRCGVVAIRVALAKAFADTRSALTLAPAGASVGVLRRVLVTLRTVRFHRMNSRRGDASQDVFPVQHWLQVGGVATGTSPTEVVQREPFGYFTNASCVRITMGQPFGDGIGMPHPIAVGLDVALPRPAFSVPATGVHFRPKPSFTGQLAPHGAIVPDLKGNA